MMETSLQSKIDSFVQTIELLKKQYRWSVGDLTLRFVALVYSLGDKTFSSEEFNEMVKYIKKNTKWYSSYRGHQMYATAALLITKFAHPQQAFINLLQYEEKMKAAGFRKNSYLSIAAYTLLLTCEPEQADARIQKTMELYKEMKKNHFWLTGSDDYPIAVLLSESDEDKDILTSEIENNYDMLNREGFSKSNGLQFLSHLLTFIPETAQIKAQKTKDIYERLKQEKLHVSSSYYGILGYLVLLGEFSIQAVEEVIEVVNYLRANRSFKWVYKDMTILVATALVTNQYMEKLKQHNELIETGIGISVEAMISAQTAALIAAVTAASAASASSASGS